MTSRAPVKVDETLLAQIINMQHIRHSDCVYLNRTYKIEHEIKRQFYFFNSPIETELRRAAIASAFGNIPNGVFIHN